MWAYDSSGELYHFGVKGMKWGKRKAQGPSSERSIRRAKKKEEKQQKKQAKKDYLATGKATYKKMSQGRIMEMIDENTGLTVQYVDLKNNKQVKYTDIEAAQHYRNVKSAQAYLAGFGALTVASLIIGE